MVEGIQTHLEVLGVHMQLVTVQLTELGKGALEAVQVMQTLAEGIHHLLTMSLHLSIVHNRIGSAQITKGIKEPLGPWEDNQQPEKGKMASRERKSVPGGNEGH